ncbi:hypothetical protein BD779DRAFT_1478294, partial [Infundibulicybe gibba]
GRPIPCSVTPARVPLQIELQEAPSEDLGQYAMQEQNLWYEEPPRLERGCGVWKMACKLRVWDIDDEDEDEDEDIDGGPTHTSAGEGEDDPDAEGDLEIDLEALDDPTFNPGLTSPPASPSELMGVGGRGGEMSAFYVPPVTDAPQEEQQQQLPPGEESLYRYTYPNPMQLQQHMPSPTLEHPHHPAPILPLPPPKLGSIPVYALRGLDLGMKVIGRGTPIDRARAAEWGWGMRRATLAVSGPPLSPSPPLMGGSPFDPNQADWEAFLDSLNTVGNASLPLPLPAQEGSVPPSPSPHRESQPTGELDWFGAGGSTGGDAAAGGGGGESTLSFALG